MQELVDLNNDKILYRSWRKDYFTSALPFRQKGIAPSIPITGLGQVDFNLTSTTKPMNVSFMNAGSQNYSPLFFKSDDVPTNYKGISVYRNENYYSLSGKVTQNQSDTPYTILTNGSDELGLIGTDNTVAGNFSKWLSDNNSFNFDNVGTFNASDMRDLFQLQKWMERNARAGTRYIESLKAHFGVSPTDARLDRPEFLGSVKSSVIISEVLQTSQSSDTSAQGNLAGKGLGVSKSFIDRYYVEEPGVIIGLTCVYPRPSYQQGINRVWLRKSRLEQFYPEFVNLSEQGIKLAELYATNNSDTNNKVFGYTGIYDEMRVRHAQVCGDLRDTLDYWVMTRKFTTEPALNSEFITCQPSKNIFAVQDEPGVILNIYNDITAIRSIPFISEPGLIDHH